MVTIRGVSMETQAIVVQYTEMHLTCEEIGRIHGVSKAHISHILRFAGVTRMQGEYADVTCDYCGASFSVPRSLWRKRRSHRFCSKEHYFASLENPNYNPSKQGTRLARAIVSQHFDLQREHIVHHWDSDQANNDISNLAVFRSQSEHMAWHRGNKASLPIWNGRLISRKT